VQKLTLDELFAFSENSWSVLRNKAAVTLELEAVAPSVEHHSGVLLTAFKNVGLVFLHLQKVGDRGDFLADEVVDRVVWIVARVFLDRAHPALEIPTGLPRRESDFTQIAQQEDEIPEVARLGVPIADLGRGLEESLDLNVDLGLSRTNPLLSEERLAFRRGHFVAEVQRLDHGDVGRSMHVKRQDFLVPDAVGLLKIASLQPLLNGQFVAVKVLKTETFGRSDPVDGQTQLVGNILLVRF